MKTANEILMHNLTQLQLHNMGDSGITITIKAMQEFADQQAMEFAQWIDINDYTAGSTYGIWCKYPDTFTTSELLTKFKEETT